VSNRKRKNVVLNLREDGVAPDDVGKPRLLKRLQLRAVKNSLIPEAVSVTNTLELVRDNSPEGGADAAAGNMIFGKAANPKIDRIDISIKLEHLRLQIGIARNLTEIRDAGQPKCDARAVIIRSPWSRPR